MSPGPDTDLRECLRQLRGALTSLNMLLTSPSLSASEQMRFALLRGSMRAHEEELRGLLCAAYEPAPALEAA